MGDPSTESSPSSETPEPGREASAAADGSAAAPLLRQGAPGGRGGLTARGVAASEASSSSPPPPIVLPRGAAGDGTGPPTTMPSGGAGNTNPPSSSEKKRPHPPRLHGGGDAMTNKKKQEDGGTEADSSASSHPSSKRPRGAEESSDSSVVELGAMKEPPAASGSVLAEALVLGTGTTKNSPPAAPRNDEGEAKDGDGGDEDDVDVSFVDFRWLDGGELERHESGLRRVHQGFSVETSRSSGHKDKNKHAADNKPTVVEIRIGDVVQVASSRPPQEEEDDDDDVDADLHDDDALLCRVTGLWSEVQGGIEDQESSDPMIEGEWLYGSRDVSEVGRGLPGISWSGLLSQDHLATALGPRERAWTDHRDVNPASTILRKVEVVYRDPPTVTTTTTAAAASSEPSLPAGSFLVRYRVFFTSRASTVTPWNSSESDAQRYASQPTSLAAARRDATDADSLSSALDDGDGDDDESSGDDDDGDYESSASSVDSDGDRDLVAMPEGKGSSLRAKISVGQKHQVPVTAFVKLAAPVRSRNPTLVWSASAGISDDDMHDFCLQLALILNPYQRRHRLTMTDPYSPLSSDKNEQATLRDAHPYDIATWQQLQPTHDPWIRTGSHVSSAGRVSAKPNPLLKECNVDALLEFLHHHKYDTQAALADARNNPDAVLPELTTAFTRSEKRQFDTSLRLTNCSMRKIADAMEVPLTTVIDYFYRFKVPQNFRLMQDKKREHALRMAECIEKGKYTDFARASYALPKSLQTFPVASTTRLGAARRASAAHGHWSETSPADVMGAFDERFRTAKSLLLDVKDRLGPEAFQRMAALVQELRASFEDSTKEDLVDVLNGYPDLQKRLQDMLAW